MESKFYGIKPFGATPNYRQLRMFEIGKKAFFHFGVNTFSNLEWGDGSESAKIFNPTETDVRSWIRGIKAVGFKMAILTAKHHDGFCLWPSKYTEHSIKNSPYKDGKGDLVKEFTDACREYNVLVGIYVSPWDRNAPTWGTSEYTTYYVNQLTEILTQYGKIDEIWWDGAGSSNAAYDYGLWAYTVRKYQPDAVIFCSMGAAAYAEQRWVGNEAGFAGATHYASINYDMIRTENVADMNRGIIGGEMYVPAEVDVSIRPGWFYHKDQDDKVKSARTLDDIWFKSVGRNAMMLLNFPPDRRGLIVDTDIRNAVESNRRINKMLSVNYADNAALTADSTYCSDTEIENVILEDKDLFFATSEGKNKAVIDITLDGSYNYNVLLIGEKIELGERITSFRLEALDGENTVLLTEGTSVGYLKASRFKECSYKRLRLTLDGIAAPITLRHLAIHRYDEDKSDPESSMVKENLALALSACITVSDDNKEAVINFGGIYPFDTISFVGALWGNYEISAFDGSKFYSISSGFSEDYRVRVHLDEPIITAYQIKIRCDRGFALEPEFKVF
jgi:alpha-L-fucosidase